MNISAPFVRRPVATTLLTIGIALAGIFAFFKLPVSPLPRVDFPTVAVNVILPGASPDTVASSAAAPLERHLGSIADVAEMTSRSSVGSARIILQFGLDRDINGAARDVQAAINAARADLPSSLRSNPTYRKVNPADSPVLILALTSATLTRGQMYDAATNVLSQKLAQIQGIGQVIIGGAALPAVRVELNPAALFKYGVGLEDVRAAIASANANAPKGAIESEGLRYQLYTNDQAIKADDYRNLVIAWRNGAGIRLADVADVQDSVENLRNIGLSNGKPAVIVILFRQPGANIIETVDGVKAAIPQLMAAMPADIDLDIAIDRTVTIRASLQDTERTLLMAVCLVTFVVFLSLRSVRATLIPAVAVPVSIAGTFGAMYLMHYSLDNLSLMALTVATGFVVDDAIVVLENISRHIEAGVPRYKAALIGAGEVGFTVISITLSLIAVFLPILLLGGLIGRLFREFAVTLSVAVTISMAISLTTTPMLCALFLKSEPPRAARRRSLLGLMQAAYSHTLAWSLRHPRLVMLVLLATVVMNVELYRIIPKGLFPTQDTGLLVGGMVADQSTSFQTMQRKIRDMAAIVSADPAVKSTVGFTGQGGAGADPGNSGDVFSSLKPLAERDSMETVIQRLRRKLSTVPGARLFLVGAQDLRQGGRSGNGAFQYTLQADNAADLYEWAPKLVTALEKDPLLTDVNSDQAQKGLESDVTIDRATARRLGISVSQIDNTLYDAFGQRQVSTIYKAQNQYHVVMEIEPRYLQSPEMLNQIYVSTAGGAAAGSQVSNAVVGTVVTAKTAAGTTAATIAQSSSRNAANNALANVGRGSASSAAAVSTTKETMIPLSAVATFSAGNTPLAVNHQGPFVAATISFNLAPGIALSQAAATIEKTMFDLAMPSTIHGSFAGTAQTFQKSLQSIPLLIGAALIAIYIVLGILYESYVHPITIISTLPSAGLGALLALMAFGMDFSIIAAIGVLLLIGIVKKNAILMIDFALEAERSRGLDPRQAIFEACIIRFRPIMMTTAAAMLGALPLALSFGDGAELRQPLGISIVGGLMVSQVLTLYTTPVVYLYLDRLRLWFGGSAGRAAPEAAQ